MSYGPPPGNQYGGYPQQGGYPPPQNFQQGGYHQGPPQGHPPQGYPPPGQPQGFPPQGPPSQQPSWGAPPPGQYPPPQQFGQSQWAPLPTPPSPGYVPGQQAQGDASRDADALRSAMKGFGTNEAALIQILSKPDPLQINLLRTTFNQRHHRDLEKDIKSETSSYFGEGLRALVRGPLLQDCYNVHEAIKGLGTKESVLNDVLLGRSNADMRAIKQSYQQQYSHTLEADVGNDLSVMTKQLFNMVMAATRAEESSPIIPNEIQRDVAELHRATEVSKDGLTVSRILSSRSDGQIRAINQAFQQSYHKELRVVLQKKFGGHMEDALILMVDRACDRAMTDAVQLEAAMKGAGTKDSLLVNRIVRVHWDRAHMDQVKRAYQHRFKTDLIGRVKGEIRTNKDYQSLMVAILS